jgi:hypothetical protein
MWLRTVVRVITSCPAMSRVLRPSDSSRKTSS